MWKSRAYGKIEKMILPHDPGKRWCRLPLSHIATTMDIFLNIERKRKKEKKLTRYSKCTIKKIV